MRIRYLACLLLMTARVVFAQSAGCTGQLSEYEGKYQIRAVHVSQPFILIPAQRAVLNGLERTLNTEFANTTYNDHQRDRVKDTIQARFDVLGTLPGFSMFRVIVGRIADCDQQKLDLSFEVIYLTIPTARPSIGEMSALSFLMPAERAAGHESGLKAVPLLSYDASNQWQLGGAVAKRLKGDGCRPLHPSFVDAHGMGSTVARNVEFRMGGECNQVASREWLVSYLENTLPVTAGSLLNRQGAFFYHRDLKPLKPAGLTIRLGASFGGGPSTSGSTTASSTTSELIGFKGAAGISYTSATQTVEGSLGEELDRNLTASAWFLKQIIDLHHTAWLPFGDHHVFEMDNQFHAGNLFRAESAPLASTFLLASTQRSFLPSDNWSILSTPAIRSISSKRSFALTSLGGTSFVSAGTLVGSDVYRLPLLPKALTASPDFSKAVNFGINSARSTLIVIYTTKDEHFVALTKQVPALQVAVQNLKTYLSGITSQFPDDFSDCTDGNIALVIPEISDLLKSPNLGSITDLVSSSGQLSSLLASCRDTLNGEMHDPKIAALTDVIQKWQDNAHGDYAKIDQTAATQKADAILSEIKPIFSTLTNQVNTTAITPLIALDYLRLTPMNQAPAVSFLGVGPAIRLTLVSSVSFTAGYSFNVLNRATTGPGAFFGSITFHDLFRF